MADDVEMTPISADELPPKAAPFGAAPAAAAAPKAPAAPAAPAAPQAPQASATTTGATVRLKPIIRPRPVIHTPAQLATPAPAPAAAPKSGTQHLKSVTGPIPAQATLRKTGIIAEGILTPAQQQAAKSKTSRISLESAIGVAPTSQKGPAPMKTIRLRRPTDLNKPPAPSPFAVPKPAAPAAAPVDSEATTVAAPVAGATPSPLMPVMPANEPDSDVTQKKTLKLHRPGTTIKRPSLGLPGGSASSAAPLQPDAQASDAATVPDLKPLAGAALPVETVPAPAASDMPVWLVAITTVVSIAALLVLAAVFYFLFQEGCQPVSGDNYTAFMSL